MSTEDQQAGVPGGGGTQPAGVASNVDTGGRRSPADLGARTLKGMFWAYGSYVGGRLLVLVSTAILARLLSPREFGLVALALVFTAVLDAVSDLEVSRALIILETDDAYEHAPTAWSVSLGVGVGLWLLCAAAGPAAAALFHQHSLIAILPVLGLNFPLRALGSTHYALAQKAIDFRSRTAGELADVLVRGLIGIGLALAGAGAWSLIIGYLAGSLAMTATLWVLVPWRPRLAVNRAHVRRLVGFGGALTGLDVLSVIVANVDYFFVGRVLGAVALGFYTLAFRLPQLLVQGLVIVAGHVLYPAFAAVDRVALRRAFLVSLRYTLVVAVPLAVGLAILARPLIIIAFGSKWRDSIEPMQLITLFSFAGALGIPAGTAYKSIGRADILLKLGVPYVIVACVSIGLLASHGIAAVAACQAVLASLNALIALAVATRLLRASPREMIRAALPPLLAGALLALVLAGVERLIGPPLLVLLAGTVGGGAAYLGLLWRLAPDIVRRVVAVALPGRRQDPPAASAPA